MNKKDASPWYLYPALDRDLVKSWWFGDGLMYFDFKHSEGGFPNQGELTEGKTVDVFRFMLEGIKKHGIDGRKIALDGELNQEESATAREVLRDFQWVNVRELLLDMRIVKTPEELALCRRAYTYFDRAHAYARDYILAHGTDVTDFEVAQATNIWINDQLYSEINLASGASNYGVSTQIDVDVRVGPLTSDPHPNQPLYNRINRNMAFQIEGDCRIGGQGGENYRAGIIADQSGNFDSHMQKLWEVSQHTCDMQVELQAEGTKCSTIAYKIHKYQIDNGVQEYIYHRPAHGEGWEGHQAPFLALGDSTVLKQNMCFSEEPGLYDPQHGCGFNWSDCVVTGAKSGYRMSRVPYSKEWCWIKL
jgi:Xaa-Pro aminopeptidase